MATKYSYSRVSCYKNCPRQFQYRYLLKYDTLPEQNADNALYLGLGLHKGIETTVEEGVAEYLSHYYCLTDANINWAMQLEYQIPKVKEILPEGIHEVEVVTDGFVGYLDLLVPTYKDGDIQHYDLYDFKFSNNVDRYLESPQLSIYKDRFEASKPFSVIDHLYFVFVPKLMIRQKKTETIQTFRARLTEELEKTTVRVEEVMYDQSKVDDYFTDIAEIELAKEYPPNPTRLCDWCGYKGLCFNNDYTDIIERREE